MTNLFTRMFEKLKNLVSRLFTIGVKDSLIPYEKTRARIFNYCNLAGFSIGVFRLIYLGFLSPNPYSLLVLGANSLPLLICLLMWLLVYLERYKTAIIFSFIIFPPTLTWMGLVTNDSGMEVYLFLYFIFTFFYLHHRYHIIPVFCWIALCFLLLHFTLQGQWLQWKPGYPVDDLLQVIDYASGLLFIFIAGYFIKFSVWKFENSLRRRKEELAHLNSIKDKVFSVISHDLKSPIGSIIMFLRGIEKAGMNAEQFNNYLPEIRASMEQTGDLLDNLLVWAKSQIQQSDLNVHEISVTRLARQTLRFFESNAAKKGISLINEVPEECFAYADNNAIQIVLRNLITNALKFTGSGGFIKVKAFRDGDFINVVVVDNGVGIPADKQELLFSDFYYTTPGTNKETGTGLGLLICKDLIHKNGGTLVFSSEVGNGSVFSFTLPVSE